jgi:hypothetical protein
MWLEVVEPGPYLLHLAGAFIIADPKSLSHYTEQILPIAWEKQFLFVVLSHKKESGNLLAATPSAPKWVDAILHTHTAAVGGTELAANMKAVPLHTATCICSAAFSLPEGMKGALYCRSRISLSVAFSST